MIFLSTLSLRRATFINCNSNFTQKFLSTLSLRRATPRTGLTCGGGRFLSTLSLRRATHYDNYNLHCVEISIHALLAESDKNSTPAKPFSTSISIHALLAESDYTTTTTICIVSKFLSTLSLRRATQIKQTCRAGISISIHALLAESD